MIIGNLFIKQEKIPEKIINEYTVILANEISNYIDRNEIHNREKYYNFILDNIDDIKESDKWREKIYNLMLNNLAVASFISKIK